jgi:hypothetical protein
MRATRTGKLVAAALALLGAELALLAAGVPRPPGRREVPRAGASPAKEVGIEDLRFMSGCWRGTFASSERSGTIEEHYTDPASNLMLGTTRYLVEGAAVEFEFTQIRRVGDGVELLPYPGGVASEHAFRLTSAGQQSAVFEAPEHDYPKRILYRREPDGALAARIDGGADDPGGSEWRMTAAPCANAGTESR